MHIDENFLQRDLSKQKGTSQPSEKRKLPVVLSIAVCAVCVLGLVVALLTDSQTALNKFLPSSGGVNASLIEEKWNTEDTDKNGIPDAAENLVPKQVVPKDPVLVNHSSIDVYMFMTVRVPVLTCSADDALYVGEDRAFAAVERLPLFKFGTGTDDSDFVEGISCKWVQYEAPEYSSESKDGKTQEFATFTYLYTDKVSAAVDETSFSKTEPLFTSVQLENITESARFSMADILVKGYSVQAVGFEDDSDMSAPGTKFGYEKAWESYRSGEVLAQEEQPSIESV